MRARAISEECLGYNFCNSYYSSKALVPNHLANASQVRTKNIPKFKCFAKTVKNLSTDIGVFISIQQYSKYLRLAISLEKHVIQWAFEDNFLFSKNVCCRPSLKSPQ